MLPITASPDSGSDAAGIGSVPSLGWVWVGHWWLGYTEASTELPVSGLGLGLGLEEWERNFALTL